MKSQERQVRIVDGSGIPPPRLDAQRCGRDRDDDVRSVAASCLLPVAEYLVKQLPDELSRVLAVLWSCLSDMKDDLSSSVGTVMELLGVYVAIFLESWLNITVGKLVAYDKVISIIADPSQS